MFRSVYQAPAKLKKRNLILRAKFMKWNMDVIPDISWFQSFRMSDILKINPEFNPLNQPRYLPKWSALNGSLPNLIKQ